MEHPACKVKFLNCFICRGDKMVEESIGYYEECENCEGAGMVVVGWDEKGNQVKFPNDIHKLIIEETQTTNTNGKQ